MHSSRMRTTRSDSHLLGGVLPQCMLGYVPPARPLNLLPGCGPEDPPQPDPSTSPTGVGLEAHSCGQNDRRV